MKDMKGTQPAKVKCKLDVSIGLAILTFNISGVIYKYHTWNVALAKDIKKTSHFEPYRALNKCKEFTQRVA